MTFLENDESFTINLLFFFFFPPAISLHSLSKYLSIHLSCLCLFFIIFFICGWKLLALFSNWSNYVLSSKWPNKIIFEVASHVLYSLIYLICCQEYHRILTQCAEFSNLLSGYLVLVIWAWEFWEELITWNNESPNKGQFVMVGSMQTKKQTNKKTPATTIKHINL